jgi:hypothetical protein
MDRTSLLLLAVYVESRALGVAREAHDLGSAIREADLIDEPMIRKRAELLYGMVEVHRDDLRLLRHPLLVGRWCVAVGCWLLRVARALR